MREAGSGTRNVLETVLYEHNLSPSDFRSVVEISNFAAIKKLAEEESCVIVGRCADYALADYPNTVSVFICGDEEDKIHHLMERHNVDEAKAKDIMIKTDKRRASYYNYYSSKRWGSCKSYDMCISSSAVGYDGAVDIIKEFAKKKQEFLKTKNYK